MKSIVKIALAVTLTLIGFSDVNAQWRSKKVTGNGNITTKTVSTGDYDEIKAVGSMDVHLERGTEGNISVTTDDNLHEYLEIEVDGNALILKTKKNFWLKTRKGIHVTVPFEDISEVALTGSGDIDNKDTIKGDSLELRVTGSGDVDLDVDLNTLDARVTGSGDMVIRGSSSNLEVSVSGSGDFNGSNLAAKNTEASVSGSGDVRVQAKETLKARVNGSGDIRYSGNPGKSDTKVSGSGSISSN